MKNNIKLKRMEKNMTQEELARSCDVTLRHMQNVENNRSIPSVELAIKIKRILNVKDIEELFMIDEN